MIKHLQDRARLPRLGVIRLGIKERNAQGRDFPREVPYFVVPDELRGTLGDKPTRIPVLFPSDDPARVVTADYIRYSGKLLTLKCDGERFTEIPKTGAEVVGLCRKEPGKPCPCGAKALARLNVIVLDGPLGVYQVLIGGEQRIADIFVELQVYRGTLGRLTDIVFEIERVPTEIQVRTDKGERIGRTGWPVHVRCNFTAKQALAARGRDILALPPAVAEAEDDLVPDADDEPAALPAATEILPPGQNRPGPTLSAPPLAAPPRTSAPPAAPEDDFDRAVPDIREAAWDWSMLVLAAKKLDVDEATYRGYVIGVHRARLEELTDDEIATQREFLEDARKSPAAAATAKAAIRSVATKVKDQNITPRPRGQQSLV